MCKPWEQKRDVCGRKDHVMRSKRYLQFPGHRMISGKWQEVTPQRASGPYKDNLFFVLFCFSWLIAIGQLGRKWGATSEGSDFRFCSGQHQLVSPCSIFFSQTETASGSEDSEMNTSLPTCAGTANSYLAVDKSSSKKRFEEPSMAARAYYASSWETQGGRTAWV